ncbi:MAG: extracellular solute-binding protein, partial [Candidatus Promineifilaceae bacterium]
LYSLDNLTSTNGLYPAARGLGSINDKLYGYPFMLTNFQHLVYNGNVITDELPTSWSALIVRERAQTLIAAAGQQGAALALQLYHAQGGTLAEGENGFVFQSVPLTAALAQIYDGLNAGVLQSSSAETDTSDMAWAAFQTGAANVAMVDTTQLFAKRAKGNTSLFGSIPGPNEPTTPIVQGLVYAVTTPDATRQALSAELISWLTEANNLGEWSIAAQQLPAKPNAFNSWPVDPYTNFIKSELSLAKAHPKTLSTAAQNALGNAVISIITSPISPEAAADFVIQTLSP